MFSSVAVFLKMHPQRFAVAALASCFVFDVASAKPAPPSAHMFFGEVQAVNVGAKTFTIKSNGTPLVFQYTDETKISGADYVRWDKVKSGQGAGVTMRLGPGNVGIASPGRFSRQDRGRGNRIGLRVSQSHCLRATETSRGGAAGIFKLGVRRDGTVGGVIALKSLGTKERDERAGNWLEKWRFRPNSVTEVQVPVRFRRAY